MDATIIKSEPSIELEKDSKGITGICIKQSVNINNGQPFYTDCLFLADKKLTKRVIKTIKSIDPTAILKYCLTNKKLSQG